MAELTGIHVPDAPPARIIVDCEEGCGNKATHTLIHHMKYVKDLIADRRKGGTGAVKVSYMCDSCSTDYRSKIEAENKAAHDTAMETFHKDNADADQDSRSFHLARTQAACDAPPHGGFTLRPLPEAP